MVTIFKPIRGIKLKTIIWSENNISIISNNIEASEHKHVMLHVFYKHTKPMTEIINNKEITGNCIIVDSNVPHLLPHQDDLIFFTCIDSATSTAQQIQRKHLCESSFKVVPANETLATSDSFLSGLNASDYNDFFKNLMINLGINVMRQLKMDQRIHTLIKEINAFKHIESTTGQIADRFYLSESRLSHLFKRETGNALKSVLLLTKLKKAYKLVLSGINITEAAIESGFYSASHLAETNQKMMGMNICKAIKDSRFLEV